MSDDRVQLIKPTLVVVIVIQLQLEISISNVPTDTHPNFIDFSSILWMDSIMSFK